MKIIGPASEFYRARLTAVDATAEPDFEWREDILYRTPLAEMPEERTEWVVEVVTLDAAEEVTRVSRFDDHDEARAFLDSVEEDLGELTKSQFEQRHLSAE